MGRNLSGKSFGGEKPLVAVGRRSGSVVNEKILGTTKISWSRVEYGVVLGKMRRPAPVVGN